jgi:UDP-N-acetylmuramoyl-L-alanyl-D-glutamate--2,6-diaminopimelate ligase
MKQVAINYGKHLPSAVLANLKYGFPARRIKVIGVTGTDGKTTTTNMIYHILKSAGKKVSMISTINAVIADKPYSTGFHVTSPHPSMIQKFISESVKNGDEYMVLEITSHALDQFRAWGVPFEVGVITNITREHLDYHRTMSHYVATKSKLIQQSKCAVLNLDDENFSTLKSSAKGKIITFGFKKSSDLNPISMPLKLNMPGDYNMANALAAAAVARTVGVDDKSIQKAMSTFSFLSGRMEEIQDPKGILKKRGIKVVVDFAHTPNALEQALIALKKESKGRVISVFGAASERDTGKRPIMGQMSGKLADITVLTAEDPRFEDPKVIIDEIALGVMTVGGKLNDSLFKEPDRQKAIELALSMAKRGDIIGIFGKGHEETMNIKGVERPWSDKRAVLKALEGKEGTKGTKGTKGSKV